MALASPRSISVFSWDDEKGSGMQGEDFSRRAKMTRGVLGFGSLDLSRLFLKQTFGI